LAPAHGPKPGTGGNRKPLSGAATPVGDDGPLPQPFPLQLEYGGTHADPSKDPALASAGVQRIIDISRASPMGPMNLPSEPKSSAFDSPLLRKPTADPRGGFPGGKVAAVAIEEGPNIKPLKENPPYGSPSSPYKMSAGLGGVIHSGEIVSDGDGSPVGMNVAGLPLSSGDINDNNPRTSSVRGLPYDIASSPNERTTRGASNPHEPVAGSNIPPKQPGLQLTTPGQTAGSNVQDVDSFKNVISQLPGVFDQVPGGSIPKASKSGLSGIEKEAKQ